MQLDSHKAKLDVFYLNVQILGAMDLSQYINWIYRLVLNLKFYL